MKKILPAALAISLILLALFSTPAVAMDEPDTVVLYDIALFHDVLVANDFLAIVPYDITFGTQPDDNIDLTFIFVMRDPTNTETLGMVTAYPRYNGGYGKGVVSFYVESGIDLDEFYIFRVQENTAYYPASAIWDFTIGLSNYCSETDQGAALRAKVLDIAQVLSNEWDVDLLSTSDVGQVVLSTYGELYFLYAIPGIQAMAKELFSVQISAPTYTKRSWSTTVADLMQTKYDGTIIGDFMTGYAGMFSVDTPAAMNVLSILLFAAMIFLATWKFKASTLSAFIDGYDLLLLLMIDGFFSMILTGLFAFLATLVGGVILFLNRS
ncbi:MAG: hypothetical protein A2Y58_03200 [Chloroflexi bacterium RBG_13_51_52]|nr:MAG: hypothetical protein A2Y58_03200 [Chloroflexi bacterium RBG_13_51_52]